MIGFLKNYNLKSRICKSKLGKSCLKINLISGKSLKLKI